MDMKKKRGRKKVGGLRVILRLTDQELLALAEEEKRTGHTRTQLIQRAIDAMYFKKRRDTDWEPTKK